MRKLATQGNVSQTAQLMLQFEAERRFLFHLARSQLQNTQWAEDVVQETALAVWQGSHGFQGRSAARTWFVSILRFKILDVFRDRARHREDLRQEDMDVEIEQMATSKLFDSNGAWADTPQEWSDSQNGVEDPLQQTQVMDFLQICLQKIPDRSAHVFLMKEYLGLDNDEIVARTGLTPGNLRIILMRSRLALRTCLDKRMQAKARRL